MWKRDLLPQKSTDATHRLPCNPRRLRAVMEVNEAIPARIDRQFAGYCVLNAGDEYEMQVMMDTFSTACNKFGLTIFSAERTELMFQLVPDCQITCQLLLEIETVTYEVMILARRQSQTRTEEEEDID
ncbi:hypothetical protein ElyMa_000960600 [Elysia marginata]|uniref:Uncharacterized protein n=1 Tax=Elysia marginata TaxID=1093978 RepID=A0AAV4HDX7_9GAST|nr:hypothetical protein ElyMa_000960600 [Elysia marginata]